MRRTGTMKKRYGITLEEMRERHNFEPKYTFSELRWHQPERFESQKIEDSELYRTVRTLTAKAYPSQESSYGKRWFDFYIPFRRRKNLVLVPMGIVLYDKKFFLNIQRSEIEVCKGKETSEFYRGLITETVKFSMILEEEPDIAKRAIPYDIRTGRVLGKYVMENLFPAEEKEKILKLYGDDVKRRKKAHGISLDNYLNTAAICYTAAFGDKAARLTAEQMYRKWADGRDCGMLEIKDRKSKKDFEQWEKFKSGCGGHPFEIVFSWHGHGIHLFPPYEEKPYFILRVTNYMYAPLFLEIVKALIKNGIAFEAHKLEGVMDYLTGESYFRVNAYDEHNIFYGSDYRKILKHIEWDEPERLQWK